MSRLARVFRIDEISQQLVGQIPWLTLVKKLYKSNFKYEEIFEQPARLIPWYTIIVIMQKSKSYKKMQLNKERNINI